MLFFCSFLSPSFILLMTIPCNFLLTTFQWSVVLSIKPRQHIYLTSVFLWVSKFFCSPLRDLSFLSSFSRSHHTQRFWSLVLSVCIKNLHRDGPMPGLRLNTEVCKTLCVCYVFHTSPFNVNIDSLWHLFNIWGFSISSHSFLKL